MNEEKNTLQADGLEQGNAVSGNQTLSGGIDAKSAQKADKKLRARLKGKGKRKWIILAVVLIVAAVILKMCMGGPKDMGLPVTTTPLSKGEISETLSIKAPLQGTESVEVASSIHSEVVQLNVAEGDRVSKGQVLAVLNAEDIRTEIKKAETSYQQAQSSYNESIKDEQKGYDKAKQDYQTAKTDYERKKNLYDEGAITQSELETAKNSMDDAKRTMDGYNTSGGKVVGSASSRATIETARLDLEQKRKQLSDATITSPIDGTVTRVNVMVGRFADDTEDKKPMFVIENIDRLELEGSVSEYDVGKVEVGQKAIISADILGGETVTGTVSRISPTGELKEGSTTERVVPVKIMLDGANSKLISGISAKAEIIIAEKQDVFVVPAGAVTQNPDGTTSIATVTPENTLHLLPVTVGVESTTMAEISGEGLTEGLQIVDALPEGAMEGMPVTNMSAAAGGADAEAGGATSAAIAE